MESSNLSQRDSRHFSSRLFTRTRSSIRPLFTDEAQAMFLLDWSERQFGPSVAASVASLYDTYFNIPYQRNDTRQGDNEISSKIRALFNVTNFSLSLPFFYVLSDSCF